MSQGKQEHMSSKNFLIKGQEVLLELKALGLDCFVLQGDDEAEQQDIDALRTKANTRTWVKDNRDLTKKDKASGIPEEDEDYYSNVNEAKTMQVIIKHLDDSTRMEVLLKAPHAAWAILKAKYGTVNSSQIQAAIHGLAILKLKGTSVQQMEEFLAMADAYQNSLAMAGEEYSDTQYLLTVLRGLGKHFNNTRDFWQNKINAKEEVKLSEVKDILRTRAREAAEEATQEDDENKDDSDPPEQANYTHRGRGNRGRGGGHGPNRGRGRERGRGGFQRDTRECYNCHKTGHIAANCFLPGGGAERENGRQHGRGQHHRNDGRRVNSTYDNRQGSRRGYYYSDEESTEEDSDRNAYDRDDRRRRRRWYQKRLATNVITPDDDSTFLLPTQNHANGQGKREEKYDHRGNRERVISDSEVRANKRTSDDKSYNQTVTPDAKRNKRVVNIMRTQKDQPRRKETVLLDTGANLDLKTSTQNMTRVRPHKSTVFMGHHKTNTDQAGTWKLDIAGHHLELHNTKVTKDAEQNIASLHSVLSALQDQYPSRKVYAHFDLEGGWIGGIPEKRIPVHCRDRLYFLGKRNKKRHSRGNHINGMQTEENIITTSNHTPTTETTHTKPPTTETTHTKPVVQGSVEESIGQWEKHFISPRQVLQDIHDVAHTSVGAIQRRRRSVCL